jgi:hypothetical protein
MSEQATMAPPNSSAVVFLGPTLSVDRARSILAADYRPPAQQGDVLHAVVAGAAAIGLVDGLFGRVAPVWHKEILWALSRHVPVYGSASMGALRAAELHGFGMIGVGVIFEGYRSGGIEDDDEVTLIHGPTSLGSRPLSDALCNIRATLAAARRAALIDEREMDALLGLAKRMYYKERRYVSLMTEAQTVLAPSRIERLRRFCANHAVDQKGRDAEAMLLRMEQDRRRGWRCEIPDFTVEMTAGLQRMICEAKKAIEVQTRLR